MTIQYFEIGTTFGGLANVESLTTAMGNMAPPVTYAEYSETVNTGDGGAYGRGSPVLEWRWDGFVPADLVDNLRSIIPNASAAVYIRTRFQDGAETDDTDYSYYTAIALWPNPTELNPTYRNGNYNGFVLRFKNLVSYTPPT